MAPLILFISLSLLITLFICARGQSFRPRPAVQASWRP